MADLEITSTSLTVTGTGFSSQKRYLRKTTGGTIGVCSGRTWSIDDTGAITTADGVTTDSGGPWLAWRYRNGTQSIDFVSITVGGYLVDDRSADVATPSPSITACDIE